MSITWLFVALSLAGTFQNSRQKISGFYLWIIGNTCWTVYNFYIGEPQQAFLFIVNTALSIWGIYNWTKAAKLAAKEKATV